MAYQLERKVIAQPVEKEAYVPEWKCFCCRDTGKVTPINIKKVIPDFDKNLDASPLCQKPGCFAGAWVHGASQECRNCFDFRFTSEICDQLDEEERDMWKSNLRLWHEMRQKAGKDPLAENISRLKAMSRQLISNKDLTALPSKTKRNTLTAEEIAEIQQKVLEEAF